MLFDSVMNLVTAQIIEGIKNHYAVSSKRTPALPITLPILRAIVQQVRLHPKAYGGARNARACIAVWTILWAGWMRAGELVWTKFNTKKSPSRADYDFDMAVLHLRWTKESGRAGTSIPLPRGVLSDVCPIKAISSFIRHYPSTDSVNTPLISFASGKLDRKTMESHLDRALSEAGIYQDGRGKGKLNYTGHSFRRGAATQAATSGAMTEQLRARGRWTGDSWKLYVAAPIEYHRRFAAQLYTAKLSLPTFGIPPPSFSLGV